MPRAAREEWLWLGLALAALLPRAVAATLRAPWHDEYFTVWAASLPLRELIGALRLDSGPPLPYLLAKLISMLGIPTLFAARAVAVAAGTGAVLLATRAARRVFGAETGWWTGAFLAFHPLAVAWSCEGRAYALLLLAVVWAWDRLEALAAGKRAAIGLACAVALACWCHGLGLLLAVVLAVVGATLPRPPRWRAVGAVAAGLASFLPWAPVAAHQPPAAVAWMATFWRTLPAAERLAAPVRLLSPLGGFGGFLDLPSPAAWAEVAAAVLALGLLAAGWLSSASARRLLLGVVLPAGSLAVLATFGVPAFYPGRGEALYLAPFVILLGVGATRTRLARAAGAALVLAAAATSTVAIVRWAGRPASAEQRLCAELRQRLPHGGQVVIGGYWRLGIEFHLAGERDRFHLVNYPASATAHPGWYDARSDRPAPGELDRLAAALRPRAAQTAVLVTPGTDTAADLERLAATLSLQPGLAVAGGRLWLPARGAPAP